METEIQQIAQAKDAAKLAVYLFLVQGQGHQQEVLLLLPKKPSVIGFEWVLPSFYYCPSKEGFTTPLEMLKRDASQLLGISLGRLDLAHVIWRQTIEEQGSMDRIDFCFECTRWQGAITLGHSSDYREFRWVDPCRLSGDTESSSALAINSRQQREIYTEDKDD